MSFILEEIKNGKDIILFNNNKFRESYSLKSGDIVWRCLGRVCKATIKTNREKNAIYTSNDKHTGAHPVTLRALTPTPPSCGRTPKAETPLAAASTSTPEPKSTCDTISSSPLSTLLTSDLMSENSALKGEVERLRAEKQVILDHSIESDQRLLEFTDYVFLPPQSQSTNASTNASSAPSSLTSENTDDLDSALEKIKTLQEEIVMLRRPCELCASLKEETTNMINSLRCLEEENKVLKDAVAANPHNPTHNLFSAPPVKLQNTFEVLTEESSREVEEGNFIAVKRKRTGNQHKKTQNKTQNRSQDKVRKQSNNIKKHETKSYIDIPYKTVTLLGDSHVRGLAALAKKHLHENITVSGICKPGARLLDVKPTTPPPRNHCYVVMAGTNDVGVRKEDTIFKHLETVLDTCKKSSRVLLVPLPTRFDISPCSPVHVSVSVVNGFMAELCQRHQGVELLDTSGIRRSHHTRHGLHLNGRGKRLLAKLVVERLARMARRTTTPATAEHAPANATSPPSARTLHHETYAAAVIQPTHYADFNVKNTKSSSGTFLGNPLQATVQK